MIAVEISSFGPPDVLKLVERPDPVPREDELLIRVEAAGVARADILQRQGKYPPPTGASPIPGLDLAGVVQATGSAVQHWNKGDRVCAVLSGGGYAGLCAVPAVQVLPIPESWTFVEAATLPENLFTVYDNLVTRANLRAPERVLIHGGSSGIGSMAIMLSRAIGAIPFVTAGSSEKCAACLQFGAQHAINYNETDFVEQVQRLTENRGVDVILDMVGGPYLDRNVEALSLEGRIAVIATQGGSCGELNLHKLMLKRGRIMGATLRARSAAQKGEVATRLLHNIWPLLPDKSHIRPLIDSVFSFKDAPLAHARMERGSHIGKIVLVP